MMSRGVCMLNTLFIRTVYTYYLLINYYYKSIRCILSYECPSDLQRKNTLLPLAVRSEYHQLYKLNSTRNLNMEKTPTITIHSNTCWYNTYCFILDWIPATFYQHDKGFSRTTAGKLFIFPNEQSWYFTRNHGVDIFLSLSCTVYPLCCLLFVCFLDATKSFIPISEYIYGEF